MINYTPYNDEFLDLSILCSTYLRISASEARTSSLAELENISEISGESREVTMRLKEVEPLDDAAATSSGISISLSSHSSMPSMMMNTLEKRVKTKRSMSMHCLNVGGFSSAVSYKVMSESRKAMVSASASAIVAACLNASCCNKLLIMLTADCSCSR